jgi:hypothetical protein
MWGLNVQKLILPDVLDRHGSWCLTLREECTLRVFENRVLRNTFFPKGEIITGVWREFHNEELHNLY